MTAGHKPVLVDEILAIFDRTTIRFFLDATVGAGGHAKTILAKHKEIELYIACDRDQDALQLAKKELAMWESKMHFIHGSYSEMDAHLKKMHIPCVDGILIDAGVSSMQLDQRERGFSFLGTGPLDMRMDQSAQLTAEEIINHYSEKELCRIFQEFGEEPRSRAIARAILDARKKKPIRTTAELVEAIRPVARRKRHLHPATLVFQALRIVVNDEMKELQMGIEKGISLLCPKGRMAIVSFHRLEDRIAKNTLKKYEYRPSKKREGGSIEILTKKPIVPSYKEIRENPRCRSAKLRGLEKVVHG